MYPDIVLIDGGLGQLHAALAECEEMFIRPPMVISLAKREEEIYSQARERPIRLPRNDEGLRLLQQVRDEAHRFAILLRRYDLDKRLEVGRWRLVHLDHAPARPQPVARRRGPVAVEGDIHEFRERVVAYMIGARDDFKEMPVAK